MIIEKVKGVARDEDGSEHPQQRRPHPAQASKGVGGGGGSRRKKEETSLERGGREI